MTCLAAHPPRSRPAVEHARGRRLMNPGIPAMMALGSPADRAGETATRGAYVISGFIYEYCRGPQPDPATLIRELVATAFRGERVLVGTHVGASDRHPIVHAVAFYRDADDPTLISGISGYVDDHCTSAGELPEDMQGQYGQLYDGSDLSHYWVLRHVLAFHELDIQKHHNPFGGWSTTKQGLSSHFDGKESRLVTWDWRGDGPVIPSSTPD